MLRKASAINGYAVAASDGRLGTVSDFLFDDASWMVRWLVVDTGNWLSGRKVLLPPSVLGHLDPTERRFSVGLTMQQVKDGPDIDTDRPVSRQMEVNVYASPPSGSKRREEEIADLQRSRDDPHLRSIGAVTGYHIHASDGEIGHVEDFLIEDTDWSIRHLIVDTRNWWPGKMVLISPQSASEIDWTDRLVNLDVDRHSVKDSPAYDPTTVDRALERHFYTYYGRPGDQL